MGKKLNRDLEKNGWLAFVSGQAHAVRNVNAKQHRNAEVMLVETVARWRAQVLDLLPERESDLQRIVCAGLARPEAAVLRQAIADTDWETIERHAGRDAVMEKTVQREQETPRPQRTRNSSINPAPDEDAVFSSSHRGNLRCLSSLV